MSQDRQVSRFSMGRWNRIFVIALGILLISCAGPAASAFWGSVSSGSGAAKADSVAQGAKPATSVSGATVTVSWTASTTAAGRSVTGYSIARYGSAVGGTRVAATGSCQGTIAALSCAEANVPAGTWYYTVTPLLSLWQGIESTRSTGTTPITDTTPPNAPVVNALAQINAAIADKVPVSGTAEANSSLTLTVSGTGAQPISQTIAVDSSGNWTALPVDVRNFADATITYSAKATDAAGNTSVAGTATSSKDTTAPTVTNVQLGNGGVANKLDKGDTVTLTFSEALKASTICSTWTNNSTTQTINGNGQVTVSVTAQDTLTVTSSVCAINLGSVALGADYTSTALTLNGNGNGNVSSLAWNPTAKTLTITLGTGGTGDKTVPTDPAVFPTYNPAAGLTDIAGNKLDTAPVSGGAARF
ncbi:hypothetical protein [Paenarthrobacter nitroguajacolicus]|uniref:hypothetical protein n=1 Tax=Paenarthrobacter nitroguajacolicus TaxID=211146 RepID=UPI00248B550F|nr:hypothetical protein [Paenarthrobacter nitroguajacolicus]MDI2037317.1 hypothetical protein [Paenarthrobacter nitroguajacolicus]